GPTKPSDPDPTPTRGVNPDRVTIQGGAEVIVGVVDTAVRESHQEFADGVIVDSVDIVEGTPADSHGTGIAALIAGKYSGYSGNARLVVAGAGTTLHAFDDDIGRGVQWAAERGAGVINSSNTAWRSGRVLDYYQSVVQHDAVLV